MEVKGPVIFAIMCLLLFTTCKKGEDDPAISLRTRKARAAGEWRLISGSASYTYDNGYNESYTFDGSNVKVNVTSAYPVVYVGKYLLSLNISKDFKFSFKEVFAGLPLEASGTWSFNKKGGEDKKKEDFMFSIDNVAKGNAGDNLFNRLSTNFVYQIKELRNKKLVIHSAGKIYSNSNGKYATLSTEYTFQQ